LPVFFEDPLPKFHNPALSGARVVLTPEVDTAAMLVLVIKIKIKIYKDGVTFSGILFNEYIKVGNRHTSMMVP
jgi:hypothetical protein